MAQAAAAEAIQTAPVEDIGARLDALCDGLAEVRQSIPQAPMCGYAFGHGDVAWNCRDCQVDDTCVQCQTCFAASDHEGHDVRFHRTRPGGCCDCGDLEAWAAEGCCPAHRAPPPPQPSTAAAAAATAAIAPDVPRAAAEAVAAHVQLQTSLYGDRPDAHLMAAAGSGVVTVFLHNDDVHTFPEVIEALAAVGVADRRAATAVATAVHERGLGRAVSVTGAEPAAAAVAALRDHGLLVSVGTAASAALQARAVAAARWLAALAAAAPQAAADALQPHLLSLVRHDAKQHPPLREALGALYMELLKDAGAKLVLADALMGAYEGLQADYAHGEGCEETTVLNLTVQLLTTPSVVEGLSPRHDLCGCVLAAALRIVETARSPVTGELDFEHAVLRHHRYAPAMRDLRYILQIPGASDRFARAAPVFIQLLGALEYAHKQTRQLREHVVYESDDWQDAFTMAFSLGDMFHGVECVLDARPEDGAALMAAALAALPADPGSQPLDPLSFHLPLHRFVGWLGVQCARRGVPIPAAATAAAQGPLGALLFAAQIDTGMWRRNGAVMEHQSLTYASPPLARLMADLDRACVQLALAAAADPDAEVLLPLLQRFRVDRLCAERDARLPNNGDAADALCALWARCLQLVAVVATELPQPDAAAELRRAVVHKLCTGPQAFSDLARCEVSRVTGREGAQVAALLPGVATKRESAGMDAAKYSLKPELWDEYNPYCSALSRTGRAAAHERLCAHRGSGADALPLAPPAPPAVPALRAARERALFSPLIARAVAHVLHHQAAATPHKASGALRHLALHLATMQAHHYGEAAAAALPHAELVALAAQIGALSSAGVALEPLEARGLRWLVDAWAALHADFRAALVEADASPAAPRAQAAAGSAEGAAADGGKKKKHKKTKMDKAKRRQEKAMAAMRARMSTFAAEQIEGDEHDQDGDDEQAGPECILCHAPAPDKPLGFLAFAQRARGGPHLRLCGHAAHVQCRDTYYVSMLERFEAEHRYGQVANLDVTRGELLCPLCKALSNTLVPAARDAPLDELTAQVGDVGEALGHTLRVAARAAAAAGGEVDRTLRHLRPLAALAPGLELSGSAGELLRRLRDEALAPEALTAPLDAAVVPPPAPEAEAEAEAGATATALLPPPAADGELCALPASYTEALALVGGQLCAECGGAPDEPALCLVCGVLVCAGSQCCAREREGECTRHARECGGVGVFFLVRHTTSLLVRGRWAVYGLAPYVDAHGEEDRGARRGRPLHLDERRVEALAELWANAKVAAEVTRLRNQSERIIRDGYY